MEHPSTLVILGNGFDVALNYKTKYSDFYYRSQELRDLANAGNSLCQHILSNIKSELWSDLESGLYYYSKSITEKYGAGNKDQAQLFEKEFNELRTALFNYLIDAANVSQDLLSQYPAFGIATDWSKIEPEFITFNYSTTTAIQIDMNQRRILNRDDSINENVFIHQHGSLYNTKECRNNPPSSIVVGIDDSAQKVESLHSFLYKSRQNAHEITDTFPRLLNHKFYAIFGCSFGDSDANYFNVLFSDDQFDKTYVIYHYGPKDKSNIISNLRKFCSVKCMSQNRFIFLDTQVPDVRSKSRDALQIP